MSIFLYLLGAIAGLVIVAVMVISQSAIHEILAAIAALCSITSLGLGAIVGQLNKIAKTAATIDQNTWTVGKAIWRQLHDPDGKNPEPKADGD